MMRSAEYEICCSPATAGDVGLDLSAPRDVSCEGATADDEEGGMAAESDIIKRDEVSSRGAYEYV